jgi:hypothetical protein
MKARNTTSARWLVAGALALGALSAAPSVAGAATAMAYCSTSTGSQVFAPLLDTRYYVPVPGGTFEAGTPSWTLTGGAATVTADDPFDIGGRAETTALQVPGGAVATSPALCMDVTMPTMRYTVRADRAGAVLKLMESQDGGSWQTVASYTSSGTSWAAPSYDLTGPLKMSTLTKNTSNVAFRLVATGGTFTVDDVYVDPFIWR